MSGSQSPPRKSDCQTPVSKFPELVHDIAYLLIIKKEIIYRIPLILDVTRVEESIRDKNVSFLQRVSLNNYKINVTEEFKKSKPLGKD